MKPSAANWSWTWVSLPLQKLQKYVKMSLQALTSTLTDSQVSLDPSVLQFKDLVASVGKQGVNSNLHICILYILGRGFHLFICTNSNLHFFGVILFLFLTRPYKNERKCAVCSNYICISGMLSARLWAPQRFSVTRKPTNISKNSNTCTLWQMEVNLFAFKIYKFFNTH